MSEASEQRPALRVRTAEFVVAGFTFLLGAIVVFDSWRLGARWAADGPQTGYFPFYVGLLLAIAGWTPGTESPWLARERHVRALEAACRCSPSSCKRWCGPCP